MEACGAPAGRRAIQGLRRMQRNAEPCYHFKWLNQNIYGCGQSLGSQLPETPAFLDDET